MAHDAALELGQVIRDNGGWSRMSSFVKATGAPAWIVAEMPPGYRTRIEEVERMTRDLEAMLRFGRLLWATGPQLGEVMGDVLAGLKLQVESIPCGDIAVLAVPLERKRRLLIHCSPSQDVLEKKSPDVAAVFRILQELSTEQDRVVLAANPLALVPPAERRDLATPEAVDMLMRLGVNLLPGPALFELWTLGLQERARAAKLLDRLHEQDGGVFPGFGG